MHRNGDPLAGRTSKGEPLKFLNQLLEANTDECIAWPYSKTSEGYGSIKLDGKTKAVHRLVCEKAHGKPPSKDAVVAHSCKNPSCVNPKHLRWATLQENSHDRLAHGTAKFSADQVREIRRKLKTGLSIASLSREYSVARLTIIRIRDGLTWQLID